MANWHTLPLEAKSLILDAFINRLTQDKGYDCFQGFTTLVVYDYSVAAATSRQMLPTQSQLSILLLVAPELQQEAGILLDKKLSTATKLVDGVDDFIPQEVNREECLLGIMKRQHECGPASVHGMVSRTYSGKLYTTYVELSIQIVNKQIKEAAAKYQQPGQK